MTKYIVQHRRGNSEQWADKNTIIPMEGEIVIEIDEVNSLHKLKIGDGIHTYAELAYLMAGDEIVTQVLAEAKPRVVTVELAEDWNQDADGKYSQVVALENITKHSRLDLQPNVDMLAEFKQLGLIFVTENSNGTIKVYSVGNMPLKAYTMQATIVETACDEKEAVLGIPVGTAGAQSDWEQEDETKADYIKNKPTIPSGIVDITDKVTIDSRKGIGYAVIEKAIDNGSTILIYFTGGGEYFDAIISDHDGIFIGGFAGYQSDFSSAQWFVQKGIGMRFSEMNIDIAYGKSDTGMSGKMNLVLFYV